MRSQAEPDLGVCGCRQRATSSAMAASATDAERLGQALWEATSQRNLAEVTRLLDAGAPADWQNAAKVRFPWLWPARSQRSQVAHGNHTSRQECVDCVLAVAAVACAISQRRKTALIQAAEAGHTELLRALVARGADLEVKDIVGPPFDLMRCSIRSVRAPSPEAWGWLAAGWSGQGNCCDRGREGR